MKIGRFLEPSVPSVHDCCTGANLAHQLKALGHPVRMDIVRQLTERDRACCGDFCACMPLAQSTISQHLDLLCKAGLVDYEPDGNRSRYSLNREAFKALARAISGLGEAGNDRAVLERADG